jgi:hypothetical protein
MKGMSTSALLMLALLASCGNRLGDIAAGLKPEGDFDPLGYVGDPASYKLEKNVVEVVRIQAEGDALVIDAFMKQEKAGKGD